MNSLTKKKIALKAKAGYTEVGDKNECRNTRKITASAR